MSNASDSRYYKPSCMCCACQICGRDSGDSTNVVVVQNLHRVSRSCVFRFELTSPWRNGEYAISIEKCPTQLLSSCGDDAAKRKGEGQATTERLQDDLRGARQPKDESERTNQNYKTWVSVVGIITFSHIHTYELRKQSDSFVLHTVSKFFNKVLPRSVPNLEPTPTSLSSTSALVPPPVPSATTCYLPPL
jgi:hypothetical protein